jgi:hypothetical protein
MPGHLYPMTIQNSSARAGQQRGSESRAAKPRPLDQLPRSFGSRQRRELFAGQVQPLCRAGP